MLLVDVNVLVYAFRPDAQDHPRYRQWLTDSVASDQSFGMAGIVFAGFLRVVTHPRIFRRPDTLESAIQFTNALTDRPNCVRIAPGPRHWDIFVRLCRAAGAKGNLIPDAYLASLAIESGCEWITADRDFSRFPGLRWRHPLD